MRAPGSLLEEVDAMIRPILTLATVLSLIAVAAPPSMADEVIIPVGDVAVLRDPEGGGFRVLVTFPGLDAYVGRELHFARLVLPPFQVTDLVTLEAYPVTTAWTRGTVSWDSPWTQPGGDYDPNRRADVRVHPDRDPERPVWLSVTRHIYAFTEIGERNYGLLIRPPSYVGEEFPRDLDRLATYFESCRLIVHFGDLER
jgi:hypothetical protein